MEITMAWKSPVRITQADLTNAEWALIADEVPSAYRIGRPRKTDLREVVNALLYFAFVGRRVAIAAERLPTQRCRSTSIAGVRRACGRPSATASSWGTRG
jgi:transposase